MLEDASYFVVHTVVL